MERQHFFDPCRHGARDVLVVRAASSGPALDRLLTDLVASVGRQPLQGAVRYSDDGLV